MQVVRDERYYLDLIEIMDFIALDSVQRAISFQIDLDALVDNIVNFPLKYRKSIYFDDENIRDIVFKGYVVPYEVNMESMTITVLGIVKWKLTF
jgi:plasmid stabilization system protein ParE